MHVFKFADKLRCKYCGKTHRAKEWPVNGDIIPFYFQKEPGNYQVKVWCPHCGKVWYIVWDNNPGPVRRLEF